MTRYKITLSVLLLSMIIGVAIADLGYMHAGNDAWPPHAQFHGVWNVWHVAATHLLALYILWRVPLDARWRIRIACGIFLAFPLSFFVTLALAGLFGASLHPDVPAEQAPPSLFGLDGNLVSFLIIVPIAIWAWAGEERRLNATL